MSSAQTFGVVGLGGMGGGIAQALVKAGFVVCGIDPDSSARAAASAFGVETGNGLTDVLKSVDNVVICLASHEALAETYGRIEEKTPAHRQLIIETSTVAPERARTLAETSLKSGRCHIEASMIGLPADAATGQLYFFVGAEDQDLELATPFLHAAGRGFAHLGGIGAASIAKVLNNAIGNTTMLVFTEAIVAAEKLGLDSRAFVQCIASANGAGMSVVFGRHARWTVSDEAQPPTHVNQKDMRELARMLQGEDLRAPIIEESIQTFRTVEVDVGLVQAYAKQLRRIG